MSKAGFIARDIMYHYDVAKDSNGDRINTNPLDPRVLLDASEKRQVPDRLLEVVFNDESSVLVAIWGQPARPKDC